MSDVGLEQFTLNFMLLRSCQSLLLYWRCSMPLAQTARLPFTDNFSVDIQIRIFSNSSGYVAEICAERTGWHRFRIGLTPTDVAELNTVLQQGIQQVADEFETGGVRKDALSKFAQIGNF